MKYLYSLTILCLLGMGSPLFSAPASAGTFEDLAPVSIETGPRGSLGSDPMLRWSMHLRTLSGTWTTQTFSISSEALFEYMSHHIPLKNRVSSKQLKFGALEILAQGGHVGLSFDGIRVGYDDDKGYSEILETGLSLIIELIQTDAIRLGITSGLEFERMRINLNDRATELSIVDALHFEWESGRWSGSVNAAVGFPQEFEATHTPENLALSASADVRARLFKIGPIQTNLGFEVEAEREPHREEYGLYPNEVVGTFYMDFSWERKK